MKTILGFLLLIFSQLACSLPPNYSSTSIEDRMHPPPASVEYCVPGAMNCPQPDFQLISFKKQPGDIGRYEISFTMQHDKWKGKSDSVSNNSTRVHVDAGVLNHLGEFFKTGDKFIDDNLAHTGTSVFDSKTGKVTLTGWATKHLQYNVPDPSQCASCAIVIKTKVQISGDKDSWFSSTPFLLSTNCDSSKRSTMCPSINLKKVPKTPKAP